MKKKQNFLTLVWVNGEKFSISSVKLFNLIDLLTFFNYDKKLIIIEHNGKICNTQQAYNLLIKYKDHIEFLTIVGGG